MKKVSFAGEVMVGYINNPVDFMKNGIVLEHPRVIQISNNVFIEGILWQSNKDDWSYGQKTRVNIDSISVMLEFKSIKEFISKLKKVEKKQQK